MKAGLHVETCGHGRPLVLLHGWAMHSGAWGPTLARLARRRRVFAADLPGHGRSAPLAAFRLVAAVAALDLAFSGERAPLTVLGWSLGGLLALAWALAHPARIDRVVLVCATPRFVADDGWECAVSRETLRRFGDELRVAWRATVLRFLTLQLRGSEHAHATLAALRQELFARGEPSRRGLAEALDVLAHADLRADVARLAQPALVVSGDRDTLTPAAAGEWLARALPAGRFELVPGAAHVPFLSHGDAFDRAVEGFLDAR
jgi:pimeloyl-[acyl-carrier protein] methyl ester esterase